MSFTSQHCTKTAEQIELVFGTKASVGLSDTMLEGNLGISKIRVLTPGTLSQPLDLINFATTVAPRHVDPLRCCQLRWTVSVINWWRSSITS